MRNWLIIILFIGGFLFGGFFIVDEREVAVISTPGSNVLDTSAPGIHWKFPLWGRLTYVYTNLRSTHYIVKETLETESELSFIPHLVINWRVTKPIVYLNYLRNNPLSTADMEISALALQKLHTLAESSNSITVLEEQINQVRDWSQPAMGLTIVNIGLTGINFQNNVINDLRESGINVVSPDKAFLFAHTIKDSADSNESIALNQLRDKNHKFYDYFMQINLLGKTARSKADIPPLEKIYTN